MSNIFDNNGLMDNREDEIIKAFEVHQKATGLSPTTIGFRAHKDTRLYDRLKDGGSCHPNTHTEVMSWFRKNLPNGSHT